MTVAIIAARGGSKRLPRKNVKSFCGIPLIGWSIIQAKTSYLIDEVYVTTDDDEIEAVSRSFGAEVIRRPDWPDADKAAANRPFLHAIGVLREQYPLMDTILTILPTGPLNKPGDFDTGIRLLRIYGADCIRPLIPRRETVLLKKTAFNRHRCTWFDKKYGYLGEAGAWTVTTPEWYQTTASNMSDLDSDLDIIDNWSATEGYYFPVEVWQYADVDTEEEFALGEVLMEHFILKGQGSQPYYDYLDQHSSQKQLDFSQYVGNSRQIGV